MGEFVKKTAFGYKPTSGGRSDPECTHVILTEDEYDRLLQQISSAEQEVRVQSMMQIKRFVEYRLTLKEE